MTIRLSSRNAVLPEIFAVDDHHLDGVRSKSSKRRAFTLIFGLSKSGFPVDQSGVSVKVPQPQTAQK